MHLYSLNAASCTEEQAKHGEPVHALEGFGEALIVAREATEAGKPAEATFDDPASRQQNEPAFGLGKFDHFQTYPVCVPCSSGLFARIALVDKGNLHGFAGGLLRGLGQLLHLRTILFVCRGDAQCEQMPERIDGNVDLRTLATLVSIVAGALAALRGR